MPSSNLYYIFSEDSDVVFGTTSELDQYKGELPTLTAIPSASIKTNYIAAVGDSAYAPTSSIGTTQRLKINALRNSISWYSSVSPSYNYNNFTSNEVAIVNIPSVLYGKSIKKSSLRLDFFYTGSLLASLQDIYSNGELVETTGSNSGSVAGIVLYDEGFLLLTGSWDLDSNVTDNYIYYSNLDSGAETNASDNPKWIYWGKDLDMSSNYHLEFSSFSLEFQGVDEINTLTMFAYADKNEANTSNNKTFLSHSQTISQTQFNKTSFVESPNLLIKNTVKSPYENTSGSFEKQTFISSIGLYDEQKNLIGIAKLATPVKKTNERSFMFKLKLDI